VGGYAITSALWILFSDRALFASVPDQDQAAQISAVKGYLFVLVTSAILFYVVHRYLARLHASDERFRRSQVELRQKEAAVRQGYVDVLDAVTGGKLILTTDVELERWLGTPLLELRPLETASQLADARHAVAEVIPQLPLPEKDSLILATSEALTNAVKHAGRGEYGVYQSGDCVQVLVRDFGPGIDFRTLPKATLVQGFSTTSTMGLGFTIMLEVADRVLLTTDTNGTTVVLEIQTSPTAEQIEFNVAQVMSEG
jgi:anti-sigma regulatory factor (Ser/Thr protein kinase)